MHHTPIFDPLRFLEHQLWLQVTVGQNGKILLSGLNELSANRRQQAFRVVKVYDKLLRMQLDASKSGTAAFSEQVAGAWKDCYQEREIDHIN